MPEEKYGDSHEVVFVSCRVSFSRTCNQLVEHVIVTFPHESV